jgi:hypothetical protein
MRNVIICPDCQREMKVDALGVSVLETMSAERLPYKLWAADMMVCPKCDKRIIARFGNAPIAEHWQFDFKSKLATASKIYFDHER